MEENFKKLIVPGELVVDQPKNLEGCYVESGRTFASVVSILQKDRIIPLKGRYLPNYSDYVVGIVCEERFNGYTVDINSPYTGQLSARDLREELKVGDVLFVKIASVDEVNNAVLAEPRRLANGEILEIEPVKVPRVIGKNASMLSMLREYTSAEILVGKNGRVYLKGANSAIAIEAILKVCRESHTSGLTDRIKQFLENRTRGVIE